MASALLLGIAACGGTGARHGLGVSASVGSAYLPPEVSSGTTTVVSYKEVGGVLSRFLLKAGVVNANKANTETRIISSTATTITTATVITDTPEEVAMKRAFIKAAFEAIESNQIPLAISIDVASRRLGGDTSGWMSSMLYLGDVRELGSWAYLQFSGGIGFGKYLYHDRKSTVLSTGLADQERMLDPLKFSYFGLPMRATTYLGTSGLYTYGQADLNLLGLAKAVDLIDSESSTASPMHLGLGLMLGGLRVAADLAIGTFRTSGMSAGLELSFVL